MHHMLYLKQIAIILLPVVACAQVQSDSTSLSYAFKAGRTEGHFRMFYMTTDNKIPLTDYYALALGGGLKYETAPYKGFQAGMGGFYIWNLVSTDLSQPDPITQSMNRYEIGQFDQTNPSNKKNIQRLEDFFIKYNFKNSFIKLGKQVIQTPFINPQDGRMRPTGEQGIWINFREWEKTKLELGWLTHISPRGTVRWYSGAASIGLYPSGVTLDGKKSNYLNQIHSKGIAVAGITHQINKNLKWQVWNYWVENIFNTSFFQADAGRPVNLQKQWLAGFQYTHQRAVHHGGHIDADKTYFDPSQKVNLLSLRAGYFVHQSLLRLNYSRITKHGRFLFPREWGREPLFTFLPRERNEGLGDVHAFTFNLIHSFLNEKLTTDLSLGYYNVADVKNTRLNKYGLPSYYQIHLNGKYTFDGFMKGLTAELLYLYKKRKGETYQDWKYTIHKVDMQQLNLIFNYTF